MSGNAQSRVYFGDFELDLQSGELQKSGVRRRLPRQSFRILTILLERYGEVVTREELRKDLWQNDTFVDFEHSLNSAIRRLREALNDSAGEPKFIETLPRLGYRYLGPPKACPLHNDVGNGTEAAALPEAVSAQHSTDSADDAYLCSPEETQQWFRFGRTRTIAAALGAAAMVSILTAGIIRWRVERTGDASIRSIAVLPLRNVSGDSEQEYLTDGMTDELITDLAKLGTVRVISHTSVMRFKGAQNSLQGIARELNVDALIEGTLQSSSGRIHINVQLLQAQPEKHLWAESYDRPIGDAMALEEELANEIARAINFSLSPQQQARLDRKVSPEAFQLYLKGRYLWNKRTEDGFRRAIAYFQEAVAKEPDYAEAYAGLADSYLLLGGYRFVPQNESVPKARANAQRALQLSGSLADAHATLGLISENYDWNWTEAESKYRQAIAFNPSYATAHHWYGEYLGLMGRFEEGLAEINAAESLDPLSMIISNDHAGILFLARQYDKAILQFRKTLEMDPNFYPARSGLLQAELEKGRVDPQSLAALEHVQLPTDPAEREAILAFAYARSGRRAEAQKILRHLENLAEQGHRQDENMVIVYLGLGDKEKSLAYMEKEYTERSTGLMGLKVHPMFDPLRSDPRFQGLLRRMNFPQ